jgi:hypothetical protein
LPLCQSLVLVDLGVHALMVLARILCRMLPTFSFNRG